MKPENFLYLHKKCNEQSALTAEDIKPFDLESEVAVRQRRNDVSFITRDNRIIILVEHQSTINPNMALRLYIYYMELVQLWIKLNNVNLFSTQEIPPLPLPEFYVAYNGKGELKEKYSAFKLNHGGVKVNICVEIIDIRYGNLQDVETDNTLAGYSYLYKVFDERMKEGFSKEKSFELARKECIESGYLFGFIDKEEFVVFYKDFMNYDKQVWTEGWEEGKEEGWEKCAEKSVMVAIRNKAPVALIEAMAKEVNITKDRLDQLMTEVVV